MARRQINLNKSEEKAKNKGGYEQDDERFWGLSSKKEGSTTIMRFVHDPKEEDFIQFFTHQFDYDNDY